MIRVGGPGDTHSLSFWIEPLVGVAPAVLPYMSDAFIVDWEKNPMADEPLFREEPAMRIWHHYGLGPLIGVSASSLINEVWRTYAKWMETTRYNTAFPNSVYKSSFCRPAHACVISDHFPVVYKLRLSTDP